MVPQLIAHGKVVRPGLGVGLVRQAVARRLGVGNGVLVLGVAPQSGAADAGLQPTRRDRNGRLVLGDVIVSIDGKAIDSDDDLATVLEDYKAGDRVKVDQLDLIGKAVCLGGTGELDSSGEYVKFEFYTLGSQILAKLVNTPVGDLSAFLSRNLFLKIKLTRENGELKYRAEAVPLVTEPTKAVIERLRNAAGRVMGR